MDIRKLYIVIASGILTLLIYTAKDLAPSKLAENYFPTGPRHNLRKNIHDGHAYHPIDHEHPVTAIVPRVWEKYPDKIWRGLQLPVLTADPWGRLGNVMGEYASLYAIGRAYNVTVRLSPDMKFYLRKIFFNLSMPLIPGKYNRLDWTPIHMVNLRNYAKAEAAAAGLLGPKLFRIKDWPFEIQLFNAYRKDIVKEFTFSNQVMTEVQEFMKSELDKMNLDTISSPVLVGIHIRRKDYLHFIKESYNGSIPEMLYYQRAMDYYRKKFTKVLFMVGSDDMQFVKQHFSGKSDIFFAPGSTRVIDMAALASCNHSIISLGSYGFWTGYLTGGEVLYPDISFGVPYQFSREWYNIGKLDFFTSISVD